MFTQARTFDGPTAIIKQIDFNLLYSVECFHNLQIFMMISLKKDAIKSLTNPTTIVIFIKSKKEEEGLFLTSVLGKWS